ncbi:MAG: phenylalanine--tRNA ligase subunit alpha [Candidatus Woykebacteria bacterium RBG_16_44_10]|uniref:Phenylalanine--tRNA ligase alpha subunit n=1 Tax=Candidatus Woykebacteria bacterium RBG_16_44_10 TaxID=1802597 RepID=A0A1G1WGK6_9BACT|nr:MAG: phenylalanine--tRNA ligase subunit alpha [Candidatus Woykebacteria bacterium RBG_16_44_10]
METSLDKIFPKFQEEIRQAKNSAEVEKLRVKYLGRKSGILSKITQQIPKLPLSQRVGMGTKVKNIKSLIEKTLASRYPQQQEYQSETRSDVTTPGKIFETGRIHPLTQVIEEIKEIFHYLGFIWTDGPEVENDAYNFQKLNIPPDHPARDTQQTYYLSNNLLLRTHTSNMQVRYLEKHKPPVRALFPGRVYRRDMPDSTHLPSFYQLEGLLVDETASMTDLLGSLDFFARSFFGKRSKIRVYGHHFPYTEPSIEVEVFHPKKGWIEILGAGMVHPNVLKNAQISPSMYRGWAFGMGPDRLVMLKYGIDDIRILYNNDLRFLNQF